MRLSEAILKGDKKKKACPSHYLARRFWLLRLFGDGHEYSGCAFGGALLAVGAPIEQYWFSTRYWVMRAIGMHFPWVTDAVEREISRLYFQVAEGAMSIETLAAGVRVIEPKCDCNRHNCDCVQKEMDTMLAGMETPAATKVNA